MGTRELGDSSGPLEGTTGLGFRGLSSGCGVEGVGFTRGLSAPPARTASYLLEDSGSGFRIQGREYPSRIKAHRLVYHSTLGSIVIKKIPIAPSHTTGVPAATMSRNAFPPGVTAGFSILLAGVFWNGFKDRVLERGVKTRQVMSALTLPCKKATVRVSFKRHYL